MGGMLYPYNKSDMIYVCPSDTLMVPTNKAAALRTRTYSVDFALGGGNPEGNVQDEVYPLLKDTQIINPGTAKKIVFIDENEYDVTGGDLCHSRRKRDPEQNLWWNLPGSRHNKDCPFSFADGHVELWLWHGTAVLTFVGGNQPGDNSDDLSRVEVGTVLANSPP